MALAGEESGLFGSSYLARNPVVGSGKVVADVNLDMPILLYDFQDVIAFGGEHSTMGEVIAQAGASMGVSVSPDPMPEEHFFERSDHYSFVKAGVPSIFLMTGFKNGGEKAFLDLPEKNYHQPSDRLDLPFNWEAGAKFARLNYLIARQVADAPEAPRCGTKAIATAIASPGGAPRGRVRRRPAAREVIAPRVDSAARHCRGVRPDRTRPA